MNICGRLRLLVPLVAIALAACSLPVGSAASPPLAGAKIGGPFTLTDQEGRRVTDRSFAGNYRIYYFGYTFCPDVCPVDVQHIGAAMKLLEASDPALARRVTPIFISVDPARDTPPVLRQFVRAFHPRMVGLTGTSREISAVASEFAIFYQQHPPTPEGGYTVDHSRQAYLFSPDDKPLALLPQEGEPQAIVAEIRRWAK